MRTSGQVTVEIDADPLAIYEMVADVTRIGEFSPECHAARWRGGSGTAAVGDRFRGSNLAKHLRWSRDCEVVTADPGREFAFRTIPTWLKRDSTVWRYRIDAADGATVVTESYDVVRLPPRPMMAVISRLLPHHLDMRPDMRRTLDALQQAAEQPVTGADRSAAPRPA